MYIHPEISKTVKCKYSKANYMSKYEYTYTVKFQLKKIVLTKFEKSFLLKHTMYKNNLPVLTRSKLWTYMLYQFLKN